MSDGNKFSCPQCGKQYPWNPELAGKKGKCKCGSIMHVPASADGVATKAASRKPAKALTTAGGSSGSLSGSSVLSGSSHFASRPRPTPKPVATGDSSESYSGNGQVEEDVVVPPPYAPAVAAAPAARATGTKYMPAAAAATEAPAAMELRWAPALKWLGLGALFGAWAIWELVEPHTGGRRGLRAIVGIANALVPMGGAIILLLLAGFFIVVGVLILLGKTKDDDYEHEQAQGAWPASRGRR